jgi:hypothetical protein
MGEKIMEPKYLWTIKWTQPYATTYQRPYMRGLQEQMEQIVEHWLEDRDYTEAKQEIARIMSL